MASPEHEHTVEIEASVAASKMDDNTSVASSATSSAEACYEFGKTELSAYESEVAQGVSEDADGGVQLALSDSVPSGGEETASQNVVAPGTFTSVVIVSEESATPPLSPAQSAMTPPPPPLLYATPSTQSVSTLIVQSDTLPPQSMTPLPSQSNELSSSQYDAVAPPQFDAVSSSQSDTLQLESVMPTLQSPPKSTTPPPESATPPHESATPPHESATPPLQSTTTSSMSRHTLNEVSSITLETTELVSEVFRSEQHVGNDHFTEEVETPPEFNDPASSSRRSSTSTISGSANQYAVSEITKEVMTMAPTPDLQAGYEHHVTYHHTGTDATGGFPTERYITKGVAVSEFMSPAETQVVRTSGLATSYSYVRGLSDTPINGGAFY